MTTTELPDRMLAGILHGPRDLRVEEIAGPPEAGPGELLIEVCAVGLCGTDLAEWKAPHRVPLGTSHPITGHHGPTTLGHEFSGVVVRTGAGVSPDWLGRLVACSGGVPCGGCEACKQGRASQCPNYWVIGLHRHGALTCLVAAPARCCHPVDADRLTPAEAALAQPMAIAVHAARRGQPTAGERAIVAGVGGIGACIVHVLTQWGVEVTAIDLSHARLAVAAQLGSTLTLDGQEAATPEAITRMHGEPPSLIYEATGTGPLLRDLLESAQVGARTVLVGMQKKPQSIDFQQVTIREQTLIGTNSMVPDTDLPEALRLLETRAREWDVLAPTVFTLPDIVAAGFEPMASGDTMAIKMLVDPRATRTRGLYEVSDEAGGDRSTTA
jgi:(R,R)-butanediol dehydrogenase/meso-butanediol dehydrogenase/diacetyl reductase